MSRRRWSRRGFLLWATAATPILPDGVTGRRRRRRRHTSIPTQEPWELDREALLSLARVLLPEELGDDGAADAVDDFLAWLHGYRGDAEMDHGYGFTRVRHTAPHPGPRYRRELAAMDEVARDRHGRPLAALPGDALREIVAGVLEGIVDADGSLPGRPGGAHVAVDLMASYYGSPEATDRCYGKAIRRQSCRGLFTDVESLPRFSDGEGP